MERDPRISKLIRESGIVHAPDQFTSHVMERIGTEPEKKVYKPLIGRFGRIIIVFFILAIVVVSIIYSEPGGRFIENLGSVPEIGWKMPEIIFNINFLQDINIPTGIMSAILALFILVVSDAGLKRRRLT